MILCNYGCGQEAKYKFKNGKWCCSKSYQSCPYYRKLRSLFRFDEKTKQKISRSKLGGIPWNKGKKGCQTAWNKGKKNIYSKETLDKMSKNSLGQPGYWLNKKRSKETIEKIKNNHTDVSGPLNPNWKGGISCEPYCEQWNDKDYKESIKERDGYICLNPSCSKTNDMICIHHIDYNKKNCHPFNLITLCSSCNSIANGNRRWHRNWYNAIIYRRYIEIKTKEK